MEKSINRKIVQGKLESITHKYNQDKFKESLITIKDKKDKKSKGGKIYGVVPESFLGRNVCLEQIYKEETAELYQLLSYRTKGSNLIVDTYTSGISKPQDF